MHRDAMIDKVLQDISQWHYHRLVRYVQDLVFSKLDLMEDEEIEKAMKLGWFEYERGQIELPEDDFDEEEW